MLPIGIQSLREIRRMDCYYVDKTAHVLRLTREGKYHFLSRPRRFGKSLLVDTLKELFEGNGELFQGLGACAAENIAAVKHACTLPEIGSYILISYFRALPPTEIDRKQDIFLHKS